jgi:hypothetical protein
MAFNPSTFIRTYQSTDKYITLQDSNNKVFRSINVCQHKKISINNKTLSILQEGGSSIDLVFQNASDASVAKNTLQLVIDTLSDNCKIDATILPPGTFTINSITLTQYKNLQSTNSLGVLQWYDVSDVDEVFNLGPVVMRVLSCSTNDAQPEGIVMGTNQTICFNCINNNIVYLNEGRYARSINNSGRITALNTQAKNLITRNKGYITATTSELIIAEQDSTVTVTNCAGIIFIGSNMTLTNSMNCRFEGVTTIGTLTGYTDVNVNKNNTLGKQGKELLSTNGTITLTAYKNRMLQVIDGITGAYTINFLTEFKQCNAEFELQVKDINYDIIIKDSVSGNTLITLTSKDSNTKVRVKWNVGTQLFEAVQEVNKLPRRDVVSVTSNGQTTFVNAFTKIPYSLSTVLLFINGKQETSFSISSTTMIWTNTEYILETTDEVILQYI